MVRRIGELEDEDTPALDIASSGRRGGDSGDLGQRRAAGATGPAASGGGRPGRGPFDQGGPPSARDSGGARQGAGKGGAAERGVAPARRPPQSKRGVRSNGGRRQVN